MYEFNYNGRTLYVGDCFHSVAFNAERDVLAMQTI